MQIMSQQRKTTLDIGKHERILTIVEQITLGYAMHIQYNVL